jgi:stage V sporulation protein AA
MKEIYLIPKGKINFSRDKNEIYLDDIYNIYPKEIKNDTTNIILKRYKNIDIEYDVLHVGEVIQSIKDIYPDMNINLLVVDDIIINFESIKKDNTKILRVILVTIVVLMGSIMAIMNFHSDVNMADSQKIIVEVLTGKPDKYLPYFQIFYSIGIGVGVALFFNRIIPNYSKQEPSPLDLKAQSLTLEIENQLKKQNKGDS